MGRPRRPVGLLGVLVFAGVAVPFVRAEVVYTAIDLSPPGFVGNAAYAVGGGRQAGVVGVVHAALWDGTAASLVDLHPAQLGVAASTAVGISGNQQVGYGLEAANLDHVPALLWTGTASSAVDLTPAGYKTAYATGTDGARQFGYGSNAEPLVEPPADHALMWNGSAAGFTDLNPSGMRLSRILGAGGGQQVGWARGPATNDSTHATLWTGSAANSVDLAPSGSRQSEAFAAAGGQQVGYAVLSGDSIGNRHALLWRGSAADVTALEPDGFTQSESYGTNGVQQVGYGKRPIAGGSALSVHALLWNGSATDYVDLHSFLPAEFASSYARGIDENGNIVGYAFTDGSESLLTQHAILWVPVQVPEPSGLVVLGLVGGLALTRHRAAVVTSNT